MSEPGKLQNNDNEDTPPNEANIDDEDKVDARGFPTSLLSALTGKKKDPAGSTSSTPKTSLNSSEKDDEECNTSPYSSNIHAEEYNMQHKRRGVALIFNHLKFDDLDLDSRKGTEKDCADLTDQLTQLRFEVRVRNDLHATKVMRELKETSEEDHSDADCLLVFVMSHGGPGMICARDHSYKEHNLWINFTGKNCPSLRGKPKLFFIQACRGDRVDSGVQVVADSVDSSPTTYTIPSEADILVAHSTVKDYYAWRNPSEGSWYVQALCEELRTNGQTRDLLAMLTFVNRRVALNKISNVPKKESMHMKVQMPTFSSKLTRLVFFRQETSTDSSGKRKHENTISPAKQGNLTENKPLTKKTLKLT